MKSSLKLEGRKGTIVLTPELSGETKTHVKDIEKIVKKHAIDIGEDLYLSMEIVQTGVRFSWGPVSELDLEEMEEVSDESVI